MLYYSTIGTTPENEHPYSFSGVVVLFHPHNNHRARKKAFMLVFGRCGPWPTSTSISLYMRTTASENEQFGPVYGCCGPFPPISPQTQVRLRGRAQLLTLGSDGGFFWHSSSTKFRRGRRTRRAYNVRVRFLLCYFTKYFLPDNDHSNTRGRVRMLVLGRCGSFPRPTPSSPSSTPQQQRLRTSMNACSWVLSFFLANYRLQPPHNPRNRAICARFGGVVVLCDPHQHHLTPRTQRQAPRTTIRSRVLSFPLPTEPPPQRTSSCGRTLGW
jgi:hypothetical protein